MANHSILCPTAELIFRSWEREGNAEKARTYLGASSIGHECEMYLWLEFRGAFKQLFPGRMYRLFNRGQREEAVFADDLRRINIDIRPFDENGNQFAVSDLGGHFGGHLDGVAKGFKEAPSQWFVTEFKTHSAESFKKLTKEGVKKAKPMHYAQMQVYMGKVGLKKAFYMAVCKDDDNLWCEVVDFCDADYKMLMVKAKRIITTVLPDRCASRKDDYRCKSCAARDICWHTSKQIVDSHIPLKCRTCCHSTADIEHDGANWVCSLGHTCGVNCSCDDYLILPTFVNATIIEGDKTHIKYVSEAKNEFVCGKGGLTSKELQNLTDEQLPMAQSVKNEVPGATIGQTNSLKQKYSDSSLYEISYKGSVEGVRKWCAENPFEDWSKPIYTEEVGGVKYFEYQHLFMIEINKNEGTVYSEIIPF